MSEFNEKMAVLLKEASGRIGVSIHGIGTSFHYAWQEDELFSTASTMKLMVLGALLEKCQSGEEDLGRFITYRAEERVGGSGILCDLTPGLSLTVRDTAVLMIILSDNTATNMCIDLSGGVEAVNEHIFRLGVKGCSINRKLISDGSDDRNLSDTSPRGFVDYLTAVRTGKALNEEYTKIFFDILRLQRYKDMFGRYLPLEDFFEEEDGGPYAVLMNKTGFMLGVRTDAGILVLPDGREYAYAVMINDSPDPSYALTNESAMLIAKIGQTFYEQFAGKIRHARMEDLPELLRIYRTAREFMAASGNPAQWGDIENGNPQPERVRQDILDQDSYVYVTEGGHIAAAFYYVEGEKVEPTYQTIEGAWTGSDVYGVVHRIASDGTVKGAGRACLLWAMKQSGHLRIDTHENNRPMRHVLEQLGFTFCGTIRLANGDPRIAFEWEGGRIHE